MQLRKSCDYAPVIYIAFSLTILFTSWNRWHLGFCKREYTPFRRGFDSFYGYWGPAEDYYTKIIEGTLAYIHFSNIFHYTYFQILCWFPYFLSFLNCLKIGRPNDEALDNRDFFLNDDPVSDSGEYSMVNIYSNLINKTINNFLY